MHFGPIHAVKDISFNIYKGEIVGLLGPNGAGKTTTMRILTTFLTPTTGQVQILNHDLQKHALAIRQKIGYLPETAPLYMDMEVQEYLNFVGKTRGLSGQNLKKRIQVVQESCEIKPVMRQPLFELSKGYKQRVGLAQALIHDPEILILDEPTSGLDPIQIISIRNLIQELSLTKTILYSTHILQEVSMISSRIIIIHNGQSIADGTLPELQSQSPSKIEVIVEASRTQVEDGLLELQCFKDAEIISHQSNNVHFTVNNTQPDLWRHMDQLIKQKKWSCQLFCSKKPTLEEIFISLIQKNKLEKTA